MTSAVVIQRVRSFRDAFIEPYTYAGDMFSSAFRTQSAAVSALQERADFCATLVDLANRALKVIAGLILVMPLINIVALQIFRYFNISAFASMNSISAFASINSQEVSIPWEILNLREPSPAEIALDEEFRAMGNQGEVLVPEDMEPLPEIAAAEYQQRKTELIRALTDPEDPLAIQDFRCTDGVGRFDLV